MKIRVLGCQGGILPGYGSTAFLINDSILVDSGHVVSELQIEEQDKVRDIFITHFHLDHTKDIAFLSDNAVGRQNLPIRIHGSEGTISDFKKYFFNNHTWPDFTEIYFEGKPIVELVTMKLRENIEIGDLKVSPFRTNHNMESTGYLLRDENSSAIFSGDTGPTEDLWEIANEEENLKAIFIETTLPNDMQEIADTSAHLTPNTLTEELSKLKRDGFPIYIYHLKPSYIDILTKEIKAIGRDDIHVLKNGQIINI